MRGSYYTVYSIFSAVVYAAGVVALLVAVFSGDRVSAPIRYHHLAGQLTHKNAARFEYDSHEIWQCEKQQIGHNPLLSDIVSKLFDIISNTFGRPSTGIPVCLHADLILTKN